MAVAADAAAWWTGLSKAAANEHVATIFGFGMRRDGLQVADVLDSGGFQARGEVFLRRSLPSARRNFYPARSL